MMKDVLILGDCILRGTSARRNFKWRACERVHYGIHLNYNCSKWPANIIMKSVKLVERGQSMELIVYLMHLKHVFLLMRCNYI